MKITIRATYEGGILRPIRPLSLAEGESVELTLVTTNEVEPTPSEDEAVKQIKTARNERGNPIASVGR